MQMNNLLRRHLLPILEEAGIAWHGWHAFRRGLATNLSELGIKDEVIQKIMRHANLPTTPKHYRKVRDKRVTQGMKKLQSFSWALRMQTSAGNAA